MLQLLNFFGIEDLCIVLVPARSAKEDNGISPTVANPAIVAVVADPLCLCIHLEVRVL